MKLVIIDDDLQFATAMKNDLLIHFCKYDEDVEIDIIDDNYFNLINANQYLFYFIDIDLNNINGYELANRIKQNQKNCYIIFVSSHNPPQFANRNIDSRCNLFSVYPRKCFPSIKNVCKFM